MVTTRVTIDGKPAYVHWRTSCVRCGVHIIEIVSWDAECLCEHCGANILLGLGEPEDRWGSSYCGMAIYAEMRYNGTAED